MLLDRQMIMNLCCARSTTKPFAVTVLLRSHFKRKRNRALSAISGADFCIKVNLLSDRAASALSSMEEQW
jgi:hypothetical protein